MMMFLESQHLFSPNISNDSHLFLSKFHLFLMEPCGNLSVDDKCGLISQHLPKISASLVEKALVGLPGNYMTGGQVKEDIGGDVRDLREQSSLDDDMTFTQAMERKWILVQSVSDRTDDGVAYGILGSDTPFSHIEFYLIDLYSGEIRRGYPPSLLQYTVPSSVVTLDNFVYLFGGCSPSLEEPSRLQRLPSQPPSHQKLFCGGSRFHLGLDLGLDGAVQGEGEVEGDGDGWCPFPKPIENCNGPRCTSLSGKIYAFGFQGVNHEVLDPSVGHWKPLLNLPPELDGCRVSFGQIPDPSNNRILVHFSEGKLPSPCIYAFTPTGDSSGGIWQCIARDFHDWLYIAAVADDVIYFNSGEFCGVLRAFDIQSGTWLQVRWASKFEKKVNMNKARIAYDALFSLGDQLLCLVIWSIMDKRDDSGQSVRSVTISFPKFSVERQGSTVILKPLSSPSYVLPATLKVNKLAVV